MEIEKITILGGCGKDGSKEAVEKVELKVGDVVSIVGPTGCGKTTLINDIELYASRNTPSGRQILINDVAVTGNFVLSPSQHPIALISQHTNFLSDLPVKEFLETHAIIRGAVQLERIIEETLKFANELTGEAIDLNSKMTELSGGQTRALLIADAVVVGNAPIILLDEIENAGIHRIRALELLKMYKKVFVFVTHDPRIALLSDFRIIMRNGAMQKTILTSDAEKRVIIRLSKMDDVMLDFRKLIRGGEEVTEEFFNERLKSLKSI